MAQQPQLQRWREVVSRLVSGPSPYGEEFAMARAALLAVPAPIDAREAVRLLLEGAMGDATTGIEDAQDVMAMLQAAKRGSLDLADLVPEV